MRGRRIVRCARQINLNLFSLRQFCRAGARRGNSTSARLGVVRQIAILPARPNARRTTWQKYFAAALVRSR